MYPEHLVLPMKADLTSHGFQELTSAADVDQVIANNKGPMLLVINSICGCAAGSLRPGVKKSLISPNAPKNLYTAFAGFDFEAVNQARQYFLPYPPSSPSVGIFMDDKLVHFVERHQIEGRSADMIAEHLMSVYDEIAKLA
jgi:putative YphP/YqiW family bacilliredoxin